MNDQEMNDPNEERTMVNMYNDACSSTVGREERPQGWEEVDLEGGTGHCLPEQKANLKKVGRLVDLKQSIISVKARWANTPMRKIIQSKKGKLNGESMFLWDSSLFATNADKTNLGFQTAKKLKKKARTTVFVFDDDVLTLLAGSKPPAAMEKAPIISQIICETNHFKDLKECNENSQNTSLDEKTIGGAILLLAFVAGWWFSKTSFEELDLIYEQLTSDETEQDESTFLFKSQGYMQGLHEIMGWPQPDGNNNEPQNNEDGNNPVDPPVPQNNDNPPPPAPVQQNSNGNSNSPLQPAPPPQQPPAGASMALDLGATSTQNTDVSQAPLAGAPRGSKRAQQTEELNATAETDSQLIQNLRQQLSDAKSETNTANKTIEELRQQLSDAKSETSNKEETIQELKQQLAKRARTKTWWWWK